MKSILFVCTQNIFRSLSAEYSLKNYMYKNGINKFVVQSAGIKAYPERPYPWTISKLQSFGINVDNHEQTKVDCDVLKQSDIIICMTKDHRDFIEKKFGCKSYLFNEIAYGKKTSLLDDCEVMNMEMSLQEFVESTVQYIYEAMPHVYENLEKMNI